MIKNVEKSTMPQHCISVMRAERVKMSIFAPNKLCGMQTVNCPETRTTLILDRSLQAKQIQPTKAKSAIAHIAFNPPHKKKALKDSTKMNEKLENRLNQRDIKPTAMRILVLQYLMEQNKATSLQTIENAFDIADKSTLYRTLKTFEKNKLVHTIDDGTKQLKYALCLESCECETIDQHYHFHCIKCQNTFCLTNQNIPKIELPKNFKMQQANMVIKGLCENCNK